jgi:hypothetical protein
VEGAIFASKTLADYFSVFVDENCHSIIRYLTASQMSLAP